MDTNTPVGTQAAAPAAAAPIVDGVSPKLRLIALLLSFFLGVFGIHRFYVGKIGTGIVMLLFTITLFGTAVSGVWNLIDFIMIAAGAFRDKEGNIVKRWTND